MPSIQVRILSGSATGKQLRLRKSVVSFGRGASCDISIDQPFMSREHGVLRLEEEHWQLENQSKNGTYLNKRHVTGKPRAIPGPATVSVGQEPIFEIIQLDGSQTPATAQAGNAEHQTQSAHGTPQGMTRRKWLWLGIGAYLVVMFALVAFFKLGLSDTSESQTEQAPALSEQQIELEIRKPLKKQPPDSRRVGIHTDNALRQFNQRQTKPGALYQALRQYKLAQAYTDGYQLDDPTHERRFAYVKNQLSDQIGTRYGQAYDALRRRNFRGARSEFHELLDYYPNTRSPIYQNAEDQWNIAKQALEDE